jgi:hypothetical protein
MRDIFVAKNSNITATLQGIAVNTLSILATNQGARPGTVTAIWFMVDSGSKSGMARLRMVGSDFHYLPAIIIEPDKSVLINVSADPNQALETSILDEKTATCAVTVVQSSFKGEPNAPRLRLPCRAVQLFYGIAPELN